MTMAAMQPNLVEQNHLIEVMVLKAMREMVTKGVSDAIESIKTEETTSTTIPTASSKNVLKKRSNLQEKEKKRRDSGNSTQKSKSKSKGTSEKSLSKDRKKSRSKKSIVERRISQIEELLAELKGLDDEIEYKKGNLPLDITVPRRKAMERRRLSERTLGNWHEEDEEDHNDVEDELTSSEHLMEISGASDTLATRSGATVGTPEFYNDVASRLTAHRNSICIQDDFNKGHTELADLIENESHDYRNGETDDTSASKINDFRAAFGPKDMRCLALVSHNEMNSTMKTFVIHYKHILKKFRLTGTQSTMKMLAEVFADEPGVVFGPSCKAGPLGGDAELVALMVQGYLGGVLYFQDPMTSHPHQADIDCLVRQALVHNTLIGTTPTTAIAIIEVLRSALQGEGKPEFIPSFFFSLQSPTVEAYKKGQKKLYDDPVLG